VTALNAASGDIAAAEAEVLVVGVFSGEDAPVLPDSLAGIDAVFGGRLAEQLAVLGNTGSASSLTRLPAPEGLSAKLVYAVGLGDAENLDDETLRRAAGTAVRAAFGKDTVAIAFEGDPEATAVGAALGAYKFEGYKTGDGGDTAPAEVAVYGATAAAVALVPFRLASVNTGILAPAAYRGATTDPFGHCTGPFVPVSEKPKQSLTLDRNESYWGGNVRLAGAEVRFITNGATRAAQVQTGEADISLSIPASALTSLQNAPDVTVLKADSPRTATLYLNNDRAPFDNLDFRKALRAALDLKALAASVYEGAALPAAGPFAPSEQWASDKASSPQQDVAAAKRLLAAAGYTPDRPLEIIAIVERAEFADVATVIQANLKNIGVPVTIKAKEYASAEPDVLAGNYDMILSQRNRLIDIADPIGFLTADYTCQGTYNLSHFCDEGYDRIIGQAARTSDAKARYALYGRAGEILDSQAVNLWLVNEQATDAVRSNVLSYVQDPLSRYVLTAQTAKSGS
jgi:ABC-type transport system substrate-binding protein